MLRHRPRTRRPELATLVRVAQNDHTLYVHVFDMVACSRQANRALKDRDLAGHCTWGTSAQRHYRAADARLLEMGVAVNDHRQTIIHNVAASLNGGWWRGLAREAHAS